MSSNIVEWIKKPSAKEFYLVIAMLFSLIILIFLVLNYQPTIPEKTTVDPFSELLKFKNELIAVIVTAFGAWIGAGAAYFFGKESLREATNSMLKMKGLSPKERLLLMKVTDVNPRIIDILWTLDDDLSKVCEKLKDNFKIWFYVIIDKYGKLQTVIDEEGIWRFIAYEQANKDKKIISDDPKGKLDLKQYKIKDIIDYIGEINKDKKTPSKRLKDIYVEIKKGDSVAFVNELMEKKGVYLGIITDEKGKPTHYFTTADVRKCLLKEEVNIV